MRMDCVIRVSGPQGRGFDSLQAHHRIRIHNSACWIVELNMTAARDYSWITDGAVLTVPRGVHRRLPALRPALPLGLCKSRPRLDESPLGMALEGRSLLRKVAQRASGRPYALRRGQPNLQSGSPSGTGRTCAVTLDPGVERSGARHIPSGMRCGSLDLAEARTRR